MVPELSQQWANLCWCKETARQRQEFQNVKGRVSIILRGNFL